VAPEENVTSLTYAIGRWIEGEVFALPDVMVSPRTTEDNSTLLIHAQAGSSQGGVSHVEWFMFAHMEGAGGRIGIGRTGWDRDNATQVIPDMVGSDATGGTLARIVHGDIVEVFVEGDVEVTESTPTPGIHELLVTGTATLSSPGFATFEGVFLSDSLGMVEWVRRISSNTGVDEMRARWLYPQAPPAMLKDAAGTWSPHESDLTVPASGTIEVTYSRTLHGREGLEPLGEDIEYMSWMAADADLASGLGWPMQEAGGSRVFPLDTTVHVLSD
jgi:hypothetical protein